ncbi:long-chain-fatty-acid--CoA ligase [Desulfosudis oleivorans]|uniref:AMP-dependent synthetase and ligase n=1 Tax=Desulfosudis oleivorans (strain DSM 6200 / JCM 39069 / Hxd3) TaxID=96561 RepID=A8ZSY3_DESOH|nr:long-chain fatty acid--CoA ligase [Desulfosudis oleivorans]ABW66147.1 AMP-dependent synthetase and ligase [Desulfosudis oleivorans Hxd3]
MSIQPWPTTNWPKGVSREIADFEHPLFSFLDDAARDYPDNVYTIFNGGTRTFAQVKQAADRVANFLAASGIKKGDRVAIFLPNLPHYPEIYFGILKAGAVCVTCNPLYTPSELNYQLKDSGSKVVFCMDHPQFYPTTVQAIQETGVETVVICNVKAFLPPVKRILGALLNKIPKAESHEPGHVMYDEIMASYPAQAPDVEINPSEDLALIIYTGGTTGVPKGAALTHANFVFDVKAMDEWVYLSQEPGAPPEKIRKGGFHCYIGVLPWYHSFGMTMCMLTSCASGSRLICVPDPRAGNPPFTEVLKLVQTYRPTILVGVPTIFSAFENHPLLDKYDLSSLICCASGGAPLPVELAKNFEAKTGSIIFEGYGLSETSPVITGNPSDKDLRLFGSVGFPVSNTDIKIVDSETGITVLPQGEDGEIAVNGPQVMKGYWQKPDADKEVFREIDGKRYFLTGDIGHIDENGYILITDRKKDLILVGGFNCYPREVEEVLFQHPKVAQAAVVGVPDPRSGEAVKAYVQLREGMTATEQEILDFCKEKLAGYKRPRAIEFRDALPTSPVGKVLRRVLKEEAKQK